MRLPMIALLLGACSLAGCQQRPDAGWLQGKWVFDKDYTTEQYSEADTDEGTGLQDLAKGMVMGQLVEGLEGAVMTVTDAELIVTTPDGNGKTQEYEVLKVPDENTVTLKMADGKVTTYHREGERMWTSSTGDVRVPFYFKRAE